MVFFLIFRLICFFVICLAVAAGKVESIEAYKKRKAGSDNALLGIRFFM
jgi:hypothetical protein